MRTWELGCLLEGRGGGDEKDCPHVRQRDNYVYYGCYYAKTLV